MYEVKTMFTEDGEELHYSDDLETDTTPDGQPRCMCRWTPDGRHHRVRCTNPATQRVLTADADSYKRGSREPDTEWGVYCSESKFTIGEHIADDDVVAKVEPL
jgi:hypothetical protein